MELSSSSQPTAETMGMLLRADAPDVQADFPLTLEEKGPTVVFEHPRVASKGQGVQYTLYGKGDEIAHQWTVTPTVD